MSEAELIEEAFILFDENGDGFISLSEMIKYLDSVFKMLYESSPGTRDSMQVSPMELATITARQCFEDADSPRLFAGRRCQLFEERHAAPHAGRDP